MWPLVHAGWFVKVSDPKVNFCLVKLSGLLINWIGAALVLFGVRRRLTAETGMIAVSLAVVLGAADAA